MKRRRRIPHCSHSSHMVKCVCHHVHYIHDDVDDILESGRCMLKGCICTSFAPQKGYTDKQLEHETVPVEGFQDLEQKRATR